MSPRASPALRVYAALFLAGAACTTAWAATIPGVSEDISYPASLRRLALNAAVEPDITTDVQLSIAGPTELLVEWSHPLSDGGSQVTGYKVEWDTDPGVREQQVISCAVVTGPNDVQSITTASPFIPEVQVVQIMTTNSTFGHRIDGTFTLTYNGETTWNLSASALENDVEVALEALPDIDTVAVVRTGPDVYGGFRYTITFTSDMNAGNLPILVGEADGLEGTGNVTVCAKGSTLAPCTGTSSTGNQISGTFTITVGTKTTAAIPYNASAYQVQQALLSLNQTVAVTRTGPDFQLGYSWTVSYTAAAGP